MTAQEEIGDISLFDRDLSWLSFNERVLMEVADPNVPLYERIKFISIYSYLVKRMGNVTDTTTSRSFIDLN